MTEKDELSFEQMQLELSAHDDVRRLIDLLQDEVDKLQSSGMTAKDIAIASNMDPSFLSRIINGRGGNPNVFTVAKIFRAIGKRLDFSSIGLESIERHTSNYTRSSGYDVAKFEVQFARGDSHWRSEAERSPGQSFAITEKSPSKPVFLAEAS